MRVARRGWGRRSNRRGVRRRLQVDRDARHAPGIDAERRGIVQGVPPGRHACSGGPDPSLFQILKMSPGVAPSLVRRRSSASSGSIRAPRLIPPARTPSTDPQATDARAETHRTTGAMGASSSKLAKHVITQRAIRGEQRRRVEHGRVDRVVQRHDLAEDPLGLRRGS